MTKEATLNRICPGCSNANLGSLLEQIRGALVEVQAGTQETDFAAMKAALDSTAVKLTSLADDGVWDLSAS